jgi:ParB family chromosome partitioning protein
MSLGRGLNALITSTGPRTRKVFATGAGGASSNFDKLWQIPVSEIFAAPNQPRKSFKEEELKELAVSIKEYGVLEPLILTEKTDGGYELVAGERRLRAAKLAGLATVPALVKAMAEQEKLEVALIENIQRENLNPIEEAFAYQRLMEEFGLTQQQVADKISKSRPAVANAVRLLELPDEAKNALIDGKINTGQARALLSLESRDQQLKILASMLGTHITVRELERTAAVNRTGGKSRRDPNLLYLENKLREKLGAKVNITQKGEQGTIVVSYHSQEELGRLIQEIVG